MSCLVRHLVECCSEMGRLAVLVLVVMAAGTVHEVTTTQTISDTSHTTLHQESEDKPNLELWNIILIMAIIGVLGSILCLTTLGRLFHSCKNKSSTYSAAEPGELELEYAEVSVLRRQSEKRRQSERRERREEETVEYGEVKLQTAHTHVEDNFSKTIYCVVRTGHNKDSLEMYCV